jgi:hypothetical protein
MLANRADTYNLGDIIGGNAEWFQASYIENAVTSNAVLAPLANRSQKDIRTFIRMAENGETAAAESLEGQYAPQELEEVLSVLRKLVRVRETVMRVNQEYILSAGQADEFRTQPAFKLQGSYRNMNRLAEKVAAIMNDDEVRALVVGHYRGESQTLTTGAEANLLRFKEILGALTTEEAARWEDIQRTFRRNQFSRGGDQNDPVSRVVAQLGGFQAGLESIQLTLERQLHRGPGAVSVDFAPILQGFEQLRSGLERLVPQTATTSPVAPTGGGAELGQQLGEGLRLLREDLARAVTSVHTGTFAEKVASLSHELEMIHSTLATLKDIAGHQRDHLKSAQELLAVRAKQGTIEIEVTQEMLSNEREFLERFQKVLSNAGSSEAPLQPAPGTVAPAPAPVAPTPRSTVKPPPLP